MEKPQITLYVADGKEIVMTVTDPNVLPKREFFRLGQLVVGISSRIAGAAEQMKQAVDAVGEALKEKLGNDIIEERYADVDKIAAKRAELNDKAFVLSCERTFAILVPVGSVAMPLFKDIVWDNVNDAKLKECSDFFSSLCSTKKKSTSEEEVTLPS